MRSIKTVVKMNNKMRMISVLKRFCSSKNQKTKNILVVNCGSSTIKFQVVDPQSEDVVLNGLVDRIGTSDALIKWKSDQHKQEEKFGRCFRDTEEHFKRGFDRIYQASSIHNVVSIDFFHHLDPNFRDKKCQLRRKMTPTLETGVLLQNVQYH